MKSPSMSSLEKDRKGDDANVRSSPRDVALAFVDRNNRHDVGGLVALMSEDHRFVDGLGQEVKGREQMEKGWFGYFA